MAIAADEIFVKVPARRFERTLIRRPFVEGMRVRSLKLCFCSKREADAVFAVRRLDDVVRTAGLLAAEIVRRHTDDHQPARMIARPKLLQAGILGCVPAERSRVDDEDRLANVISKLDVCTLEPGKRKGVGGDAGHGGGFCEKAGGEGTG